MEIRREEGKVIERNKRVNEMFRFGGGRKKGKKMCSYTNITRSKKFTFPPNLYIGGGMSARLRGMLAIFMENAQVGTCIPAHHTQTQHNHSKVSNIQKPNLFLVTFKENIFVAFDGSSLLLMTAAIVCKK